MNISDKTFQERVFDRLPLAAGYPTRMVLDPVEREVTQQMLDEIHFMLRELTHRAAGSKPSALPEESLPNGA